MKHHNLKRKIFIVAMQITGKQKELRKNFNKKKKKKLGKYYDL